MMKKLLFITFLLLTISLSAQNTYDIEWTFNSNSDVVPSTAINNADRTIEVGDTVRWTWVTSGSHNVSSKEGSQETFRSGDVAPVGTVFSYTFTEVGTNDYRCEPHANNMFGTITVVAEGTLSTAQFNEEAKFDIAPNPGKNVLNLKLASFDEDLKIEVFDVLGKRVYRGIINQLNASVNVSSWNSGVYLVRVSNNKSTQTKRFLKQ